MQNVRLLISEVIIVADIPAIHQIKTNVITSISNLIMYSNEHLDIKQST